MAESTFFKAVAEQLGQVADKPVALLALVALIAAATLLFLKNRELRSLDAATRALPEKHRLEAIKQRFRTQPREGISAHAWLKSRRQVFLFFGYLATLLAVVVVIATVLQNVRRRPGGSNHRQLREAYTVFHTKIEAFILEARNIRNVFAFVGEKAVEPDQNVDADLTKAIKSYNATYHDLRTNQVRYVSSVTHWLEDQPETRSRVQAVFSLAMNRVHRLGVFKLNVLYRRMVKTRSLRGALAAETAANREAVNQQIAQEKAASKDELDEVVETINQELTALESVFGDLTREILSNA